MTKTKLAEDIAERMRLWRQMDERESAYGDRPFVIALAKYLEGLGYCLPEDMEVDERKATEIISKLAGWEYDKIATALSAQSAGIIRRRKE